MEHLLPAGVSLKTGETRASILDARRTAVLARLTKAAEIALTEKSVAEVALGEILASAKVAKATFYKLFDDLPHFYRYVAEGLHVVLRRYQLEGAGEVDRNDWRAVFAHLGSRGAAFYIDHPAAMRLWLALDSPPNIRAVDQASDEVFLRWLASEYADTAWHDRLPVGEAGVEVLQAGFRIYDTVLGLGFQHLGARVTGHWFKEAGRASTAYLQLYLD